MKIILRHYKMWSVCLSPPQSRALCVSNTKPHDNNYIGKASGNCCVAEQNFPLVAYGRARAEVLLRVSKTYSEHLQ